MTIDSRENKWQSVRLQTPQWAEDLVLGAEAPLQTLSNLLSLTNAVLDASKAYGFSVSSALRVLLEELRATILATTEVLARAGIYLASDLEILEANPTGLLGGYPEWQSRMVARLRDTQDPEYPDLSPDTKVLALFFYASVPDIPRTFLDGVPSNVAISQFNQIGNLIKFLRGVLGFFGVTSTPIRPYAPPVDQLSVRYGLSTEPSFLYGDVSNDSDAVLLEWSLGRDASGSYVADAYDFLVTVSTRPEPYELWYRRDSGSKTEDGQVIYEQGLLLSDGMDPLDLYGGFDQISPKGKDVFIYPNPSQTTWLRVEDLKKPKQDVYYLQRSFWVDGPTYVSSPGELFRTVLRRSHLPLNPKTRIRTDGSLEVLDADPIAPSQYYVRVQTVRKRNPTAEQRELERLSADAGLVPIIPSQYYRFVLSESSWDDPNSVPMAVLTGSDLSGPVSAYQPIAFLPAPGSSGRYMDALVTVVGLAALCRCDIGDRDVDLRLRKAISFLQSRLGVRLPEFLARNTDFRESLLAALRQTAQDLQSLYPLRPQTVEALATQIAEVLGWTFADSDPNGAIDHRGQPVSLPRVTVLDALISTDTLEGLAASYERIQPESLVTGLLTGSYGDPLLTQDVPLIPVDSAPVWFQGLIDRNGAVTGSGTAMFVRSLVPERILEVCADFFDMVQGNTATEGGWSSYTPDSWISWGIELTRKLEFLVNQLLSGLVQVSEMLDNQTELLSVKIDQMTQLLSQLRAALNAPFRVQFGGEIAMLSVVANGIDGVLQALPTAQLKPKDGRSSQSAGAVVVIGGIPDTDGVADKMLNLFGALFEGTGPLTDAVSQLTAAIE